MRDWYKHNIPAWMDFTESLDGDEYRVFHVILQMSHLNGGPVKNNEAGLAGRCRMSRRKFNLVLSRLIVTHRVVSIDGRLFASGHGDLIDG